MQACSVILSPQSDVQAAAVHWALQRSGVDAVWCRSGSLCDPLLGPLSIEIAPGGEWKTGGRLRAGAVTSVWFRRPRDATGFPRAQASDAGFLREEWKLFRRNVDALTDTLSDALWVNRPSSAYLAENKLVQLRAAQRSGLRIPATLVSNDPDQILAFRKRHGRVIYKTFSPHTWLESGTERMFVAHARLLEPDDRIAPEVLALSPGIYQAYVDKVCDLRITVIGDRAFPVRLQSKRGGAFVDWRGHTQGEDFHSETCDIPGPYWERLQTLLRELGLVYGCIDVVVDHDGGLHFLEVNQAGQFLFAEVWQERLPLLAAMSAMLAEGRTDYSLDAGSGICYRSFRASEAYQAWAEQANATERHATHRFVTVE